jgi:ubiquinol-cytochrome c reductase cytochrome c1 subunit
MKKLIVTLIACLTLAAGAAHAAEGGIPWDKFPVSRSHDLAALQNGAKLFVNYCLNCHSAQYMRYNRMRDIGLSEDQIKKNLAFATEKIGETMKNSIDPKQGKDWFGGVPPDLTVIARSRSAIGQGSGADYLYTYLRSYYRDDTKATGWNNLVFPSVGMPHVLWELQGQRGARFVDRKDPHNPSRTIHAFAGYEQISPGTMSQVQYDEAVADLVAFMNWMAEPEKSTRLRVGVWVLLYLGVVALFAWRLNAAYWKEVK